MHLALACDTSVAHVSARRRLAVNVICLFADERPPVINRKHRGQYPRNVIRSYRFGRCWQRGTEATLFTHDHDHGKHVRLIYKATASDQKSLELEGNRENWFYIQVLSTGHQFFVHTKELRRVRS